MSKILTVFGATGRQGGSVINHFLEHPELSTLYHIRAITRDVNKPSAVALATRGVDVVSAHLYDKESVTKAVKGSSVVFGVTNFWETMDKEVEISQGKNIVDAAKAANVERLVLSSLVNVTKGTSKAKLLSRNTHAREGVPATYFMPSIFDGLFLGNIRKTPQGGHALGAPFEGSVKILLIDIESDAGLFVSAILLQLPDTLNKRVVASGGYVTLGEAVSIFTEVTGKKAVCKDLGWDIWRSFLPPNAKEELTGSWQLMQNHGYYAGEPDDAVEQGHALVARAGQRRPVRWREFVDRNFKP